MKRGELLLRNEQNLRVVTGVATLIAQSLLEVPDKVSVPGQEGTRVVDLQCLVDVRRDEVIVAGTRTRRDVGGRARRQLLKADHGLNVRFLLSGRESPPIATDTEVPKRTLTALLDVRVTGDRVGGGVVGHLRELVQLGLSDRQ